MTILGICLARSGSKSVPNKNMAQIGGVSLIGRVGLAAAQSDLLDDVIISTDCEQYGAEAERYGMKFLFKRPARLAEDGSTSADSLIHAVNEYERITGQEVSTVVELMCTNPFKSGELIDKAISLVIDSEAGSVITVTRVLDQHPNRLKTIDQYGRLSDIWTEVPESRRQDLLPAVYVRNGNIYVISRELLFETRQRYFNGSSYALIQEGPSVNIDSDIDLKVAGAYFA